MTCLLYLIYALISVRLVHGFIIQLNFNYHGNSNTQRNGLIQIFSKLTT